MRLESLHRIAGLTPFVLLLLAAIWRRTRESKWEKESQLVGHLFKVLDDSRTRMIGLTDNEDGE
jgi:hypothetical protein